MAAQVLTFSLRNPIPGLSPVVMLLGRKTKVLRGRGFETDQGRILGQKNRNSGNDFSLCRMSRGVQIYKVFRISPRIARDIAKTWFKKSRPISEAKPHDGGGTRVGDHSIPRPWQACNKGKSVRFRSLSISMDRAQEYYAQDTEWAGQVLFSPAQGPF